MAFRCERRPLAFGCEGPGSEVWRTQDYSPGVAGARRVPPAALPSAFQVACQPLLWYWSYMGVPSHCQSPHQPPIPALNVSVFAVSRIHHGHTTYALPHTRYTRRHAAAAGGLTRGARGALGVRCAAGGDAQTQVGKLKRGLVGGRGDKRTGMPLGVAGLGGSAPIDGVRDGVWREAHEGRARRVVSRASKDAVLMPSRQPPPSQTKLRMAPYLVTEAGARHVEQRVQVILGATLDHRCKIGELVGRGCGAGASAGECAAGAEGAEAAGREARKAFFGSKRPLEILGFGARRR